MMAATEHLVNPVLRRAAVPEIRFRISIDHGFVTLARLGAARRFNAVVAVGDAANFASKMLKHAKPGDIVLGEKATLELPQDWSRAFATRLPLETGWTYRLSGLSYPLYRYDGRWARLI